MELVDTIAPGMATEMFTYICIMGDSMCVKFTTVISGQLQANKRFTSLQLYSH